MNLFDEVYYKDNKGVVTQVIDESTVFVSFEGSGQTLQIKDLEKRARYFKQTFTIDQAHQFIKAFKDAVRNAKKNGEETIKFSLHVIPDNDLLEVKENE